jgi:dienelactone hydrolase
LEFGIVKLTRVRKVAILVLFAAVFFAALPELMLYAADHKNVTVTYKVEKFANLNSEGSSALKALVWYPKLAGTAKLAKAPTGGFPVIVFLHGFGGPAFVYPALGRKLASRGYIVVFNDTAILNPKLQRKDAIALFHALKASNENSDSPWYKSMNLNKVGLAGHSMGAGTTAHTLAQNPGYKAGFCFAPWPGGIPFTRDAGQINVPLAIVHGEGDTALPWKKTAKALLDSLPADSTDSFLYLLNADCYHQNVARSVYWGKEKDRAVFQTTTELCLAFFDKHLKGEKQKLQIMLANNSKAPRLTGIYKRAQRSGQ